MQRTSIMTIANEKTSASLLNAPRLAKISGAIHRVLSPRSSEVLCIESMLWVTTARPQSVIIAWPVVSTRMFDWSSVNMPVVKRPRMIAHPSEIPVDNVAGVKVIQAFGDIR